MELKFTVNGEPAPQGSKNVFRGRVVDASKKTKPWREAVVSEVLRRGFQNSQLTGPIRFEGTFYFKRPQSHYTTKGLRATAPQLVARTPDIDKLMRSTFDALTQSGIIPDDKWICIARASKVYSIDGWQGAQIHLEEIND